MSNKRALAYIRTSTDDKQDASPDVQLARIQDYCQRTGLDLVDHYVDAVSGGAELDRRPGLKKVIAHARRDLIDTILCVRLDRAFRDIEVSVMVESVLKKMKCRIYGVDDPVGGEQSANSTLVRNIMTSTAQFQREITSQMMKNKQQYKVNNGIPSGGDPPFGYRSVPRLHQVGSTSYSGWVPDEEVVAGRSYAEWYRWIINEFQRHQNSTDIACKLTEMGVPTPRLQRWNRLSDLEKARKLELNERRKNIGNTTMAFPPSPIWDASVLSDLLRSRTYLGEIAYNKEWHPGRHAPLIDETTFLDVQTILSTRGGKRQPRKRDDVLLTGMILCSFCGRRMTRVGKEGNKRQYDCNLRRLTRSVHCKNKVHNAYSVDKAAFRLLVEGVKLRRNELLDNQVLIAIQAPVSNKLADTLRQLHEQRRRVIHQHEIGAISDYELERKVVPLVQEIKALEKQIQPGAVQPTINEIEAVISNLEQVWGVLSMDLKREVLRAYVPGGFRLGNDLLEAQVCGNFLTAHIVKGGPGTRHGHTNEHSPHQDDGSSSARGVFIGAAGSPTTTIPRLTHPALLPAETAANYDQKDVTRFNG